MFSTGTRDDGSSEQAKLWILNQLANRPGAVDLIAMQGRRDEEDRAVLRRTANVNRNLDRHAAVALAHGEGHIAGHYRQESLLQTTRQRLFSCGSCGT